MTDEPSEDAERRPVDEHVRAEVVRFARALRAHGVDVPLNAGVVGARALAETGLTDRERVRAALRAALVTDRAAFEPFDRLFETFWNRLVTDGAAGETPGAPTDDDVDGRPIPAGDPEPEPASDGNDDGSDLVTETRDGEVAGLASDTAVEDEVAEGDEAEAAVYSPTGRTRTVDGSVPDHAEGLREAFDALTDALAALPGRRYGSGDDRPNPRRALRESVSTGGTVLSVPRRSPSPDAVRALFVVDVSRSVLDTLDRGFLVAFLRLAVREWRDARVCFFDEHLREVTDALDAPSADAGWAALEAAETEWGGGTRIGASLSELRESAPAAADRRTVTFLVSDGLETGEVDDLERELSWLARRSRRLLWLNPVAGSPGYEPTARGMAAALPYLDGLFVFQRPDDVAELARQIERAKRGGRLGYEYDPRREASDARER